MREPHGWATPYATVAREAEAGRTVELLAEVAGPMQVDGPYDRPVTPVRRARPSSPPYETVSETTFGIWQEDAYQAWLDAETLRLLRHELDPASLRVAEIDEALRRFTLAVDPELPDEAFLETCRWRSGRLRSRPCA